MSDAPYQTQNMLFRSKGVSARYADDALPSGTYLLMTALEEIQEEGLATRLGTTLLTKSGTTAQPLGGVGGVVHSIAKLSGLNGQAWRYASVGEKLYRISGLNPGSYTLISSSLSGQPWTSVSYQPLVSSAPIQFFADSSVMLKDNGVLSAPQNNGILQPKYPVSAQAQVAATIVLDPYTSAAGSYTTSNVTSFTANVSVVSTTLSTAVAAIGIQDVSVAATPNPITLFQTLLIDSGGNAETVLVLQVTATGFVAAFTKTHLTGVAVVENGVTGAVAASTTASISFTLAGTPISAWPDTLDQSDYIGLSLYVGDPNAIQSITLQFNTANGAYFYRTIGQSAAQSALNAQNSATTAATNAIISNSLSVYTAAAGGVTELSTVPGWTSFLQQLQDFTGAGGADFNDPVMNWANVTSYMVTIVTGTGLTTTTFPIAVKLGSLVLFGGAGPDSFAGVSYDYLVTLFNINDYTESNPCMTMSDVNPPLLTNRVLPRRQPVLLNWSNSNVDTQATHWRVYRRGGTLADNYRRIDQIPITAETGGIQSYTDIWSDLEIQQNDTISFTNDVPVTSTLPVPVNTTLTVAIGTTGVAVNAVTTITPASMANISVNQQVDIGNVSSSTFEVVIVISITGTTFNAFVQNYHALGEAVSATASYAQPLSIMAVANDIGYYAGDPQNPSYLYFSEKGNIQAVGSANYIQVSSPSDPITAIVSSRGNLFVSTLLRWWSIAPGSQVGSSPIVYATSADHGCVGKNAWVLKDGNVYYLAVDGPRVFTGGGSQLISEIIQFIWQGIGPTPIVQANPAYFANARVSYWNQFVMFAYTGMDGNQHRLVLDTEQKRWRNDDLDCQSMFFEQETNSLVWGDSNGLVHLDRQNVSYDETSVGGVVVQTPIAITLQSPYGDQGQPSLQKNYQEFTGDFNTNGNPVTVTLLLNDGQITQNLGTITTTQRQRINLNLNGGAGYMGYKASIQLTGSGISRIYLFQAKLKYLDLAMTRQSYDSFVLRLGTDESKILKNIFVETTASAPITCNVYYDGNTTPGYTFTVPTFGGVRNAFRFRLPAIKFRTVRFIFTSPSDFLLWETSKFEWKPLKQGSGYSTALLMP